jgi:hypothetical protein
MHKVHGITSSAVIKVVPTATVLAAVPGCEFMVQNGSFIGNGTKTAPFTHVAPAEFVKNPGLPGIGKSNPQAVFPDHALVGHGADIYDPSYGGGPVTDLLTWERAGIAGLCAGGTVEIVQDGQRLRMRELCSKGFAIYVAVAGDTLASIAMKFGIASEDVLYNHPYNAGYRGTHPPASRPPPWAARLFPGAINAGDSILIPRDISNIAILDRV